MMHCGELFRKAQRASALLLILLLVRGTGGADDGAPGPEKFDRSSAYRQRRFTSAPDASYQLDGFMKEYLDAITSNWLMVVPEQNPIILDMFRDQDRLPYR